MTQIQIYELQYPIPFPNLIMKHNSTTRVILMYIITHVINRLYQFWLIDNFLLRVNRTILSWEPYLPRILSWEPYLPQKQINYKRIGKTR